MFLDTDIQQFKQRGIDTTRAQKYLSYYQNGFAPIQLVAALGPQNGLKVLSETEKAALLGAYHELIADKQLLKFTPASGAASRMFKTLHSFLDSQPTQSTEQLLTKRDSNSFAHFWQHINKFAFYPDLKAAMHEQQLDIEALIEQNDYSKVCQYLLRTPGLNYAALPKALLKFHSYANKTERTAIEEHLEEAAAYCCNTKEHTAHLHFTVSPEHKQAVEAHLKTVVPTYEQKHGITYHITFSTQKPSTDIFAVHTDNSLFRLPNGSMLFRPGGHGALIDNLDALEADIIFIKNIDNVVPDKLKTDTIRYKKILAAYLIEIQSQTHEYLEWLEDGNLSSEELDDITAFSQQQLGLDIPTYLHTGEAMEKIDWLYEALNKPMRVCGMVRNEGEPGGGPFVVEDSEGQLSFQIVESSQIDMADQAQAAIAQQASHFNPVDLVCATKDYRGKPFALKDFIDPDTGFIAEKSYEGTHIKAQELPGLWNGAMAHWISLFVEVPISTFNPVKTINDLLREQHQ